MPPLFFTGNAINDLGQVGGDAQTSTSLGAQGLAAIASGGVTTFVPAPFSNFAAVTGLNNAGDYVGTLSFGTTSAFAMFGGAAVTLATPPNPGGDVQPNGINNERQVVGTASTYTPAPNGLPGTEVGQGFVSSNGAYVTLNVPGATTTDARGINDAGQVVGSTMLTPSIAGPRQGFLYSGGAFTMLDRPGAFSTYLTGINNAGEVVGYTEDATGRQFTGFTEAGGVFSDIAAPAGQVFIPEAVNNLGALVGLLVTPGEGLFGSSFVATPQAVPEPATAVVLGGGLLMLGAIRRRRGGPGITPGRQTRQGSEHDQRDGGEIGAVAPHVARQQRQPGRAGMGADQEVRQHARARSAAGAVGAEYLAGQEQAGPWDRMDLDADCGQHGIHILDTRIAHGHFSIGDVADDQGPRKAAASSWPSDHAAQRESAVATSSRTLASTSVTPRRPHPGTEP